MQHPIHFVRAGVLLALISIMARPAAVHAQSTARFGIKGGLNASTLFIDNVDNRRERIGFHAGVFAQAPITSFIAIQPELLYTTKGASADYNLPLFRGKNTFQLNYAELPLLLTFKLGNTAELQAGPYAAYLLNANIKTEGSFGSGTRDINADNFNRLDYGLAGGLNVYFGKALIGLRYGQGLNRIASDGIGRDLLGNTKNAVGMVSVGFSLN
ncbi:MAG: PorT family protein [Bacteroidetes bacterium]|nr:PorT family protein [Fibrella sp.]